MKTKVENFRKEIVELGLTGKTLNYLIVNHNALYHRIYHYAKKENLWVSKLFYDFGLVLLRVDQVDSIERLDIFILDMFHYGNKDWSDIPVAHKSLIKKTILQFDIQFDAFLSRYNISNTGMRVYQSIDEIRNDLSSKGLINPSISQIRSLDGHKTIANIESFAKKNGFTMKDIWFALHVPYEKDIVTCKTGVKKDFVYHNDDEMIKDVQSKGLMGKTKREVWEYDNGKTVARINKYANRCDVSVQEIWEKLDVRKSPKMAIEMEFSTISQLKALIKQRNLFGKTTKDIVDIDPNLYAQVKKFARNGVSMRYIWEEVGITKSQGFSSVDEIVAQIQLAGYKTAKDIRNDWNFYKKIAGFIKRNNISTTEIWERAGIIFAQTGRPSKK